MCRKYSIYHHQDDGVLKNLPTTENAKPLSFPRRRESSDVDAQALRLSAVNDSIEWPGPRCDFIYFMMIVVCFEPGVLWIPACAGMTELSILMWCESFWNDELECVYCVVNTPSIIIKTTGYEKTYPQQKMPNSCHSRAGGNPVTLMRWSFVWVL
ncbi:hypothetical protein KDD30_23865 (plasmid) [Photobacterium sp. GJ3]|uniref:hypothetical protein n=1 Tax=Photobacterium sp. GJ3 TaxID=2829502 RepID=UPI001B8B77FA|nr:hypothetical protein [Photobacterium sp. GJ3]QUJ69757.1 hypothetical protein KDD30_23865 [Photobacterium sp. GJ3]